MGRVLVVDGPEKAGKTTLCRALAEELGLEYRHWGPIRSDTEFGRGLKADQAHDKDWVWDRSWASDSVYGQYFRDPESGKDTRTGEVRRLSTNHWLGHWLYGYPAATTGLLLALTHTWAEHDETDLPIPQEAEREAYNTYARYFGWWLQDTPWELEDMVERVGQRWNNSTQHPAAAPPAWVGSSDAPVVVVGEQRNDPAKWGGLESPYPGPFSSHYTTRFARVLGFGAFDVAWTNTDECDPRLLAGKYVVACGGVAYRNTLALGTALDVFHFPHPAHFYRWGEQPRIIRGREAEFVRYVHRCLDIAQLTNATLGHIMNVK